MRRVTVGVAAVLAVPGVAMAGATHADTQTARSAVTGPKTQGDRVMDMLPDRRQAFLALQACESGELIQNSIVELSEPAVGADLQPDPVQAVRDVQAIAFPGILGAQLIQMAAATDGIRFAVLTDGSPQALFDVVINGTGNWAVSGWTGCADTFRDGASS